jgi:hypothetical protein
MLGSHDPVRGPDLNPSPGVCAECPGNLFFGKVKARGSAIENDDAGEHGHR